jgi:hypothetical protein
MSRKLLNRSYEVLGVDQKIWIIAETGGYGDGATGGLVPLAAGAIEHISTGIKFDIPREDSAARSGRSLVTRLSGKKSVEISFEGYIIPGTPAGGNPTNPPIHPLILSAFGDVDLSDASKIVYKLSRLNDKSFRVLEEATHYTRLATGCVIDKLTFTLPGDGKAQVKAEGFAQDVVIAGSATVALAIAGGNVIEVDAGKGDLFEVGALLDIVDKDDGVTVKNTARKVTAVSMGTGTGGNDQITVSGAVLSASDLDDLLVGHAPQTYDPITSENALLGLKGSFTVAGYTVGDCELISAEIGLTNNFTKKDFLYGTSKICGYIPDKRRSVSVKLDVLLNKDNFAFYARNKKFTAEDITITLEPQDIPAPSFSSSDALTFEFKMPRVEFNIPPIEQPGDKYVTLSLEGVALASDINSLDDELVLTIK